jgi:predicted aldo/keto reductase-like oxidoreductase
MSTVTRREFLAGATAALGAATLIAPPVFAAQTAPKIKKGTDLITLGKSGIKSTVLGVGTGTRGGSEQRAMGEAEFVKLIRYAFDRGIRYIDTAQQYQTHRMVGAALKELPREQVFVQTKIPTMGAMSAEATRQALERCRRDLGIEQFDTVLMHAMRRKTWPTDLRPRMDALREEKEKGRIRAVGVSIHDMGALAAVADSDFADVCLVRVNPFAINTDGEAGETAGHLKKIHQNGCGVIGMKIYGETGFRVKGKDAPDSRQKRLQSLKYVLGLGCIDCFTIGFSDPKQIDETLELIEEAQA